MREPVGKIGGVQNAERRRREEILVLSAFDGLFNEGG